MTILGQTDTPSIMAAAPSTAPQLSDFDNPFQGEDRTNCEN